MEKSTSGDVDVGSAGIVGGELGVSNVNVVDNDGVKFNPSLNASISTFSPNFLNNFLCYPTVLFNGTITSTAGVGTDIYTSPVSPTLLKSNALTRIKNFASNFRQWNGSFCLRIIFTKPIFVQTKIIAAFIPGITISDADNLDVYDLYGAQYHSVMNPDNDNELSFLIPFITGLNWLNMEDSTGVVSIKLFQPLIASQPTGVSNVSIPFTILLSSDPTQGSSPLNFRFLIAPSFENPIHKSNAMGSLINSISPSCNPLKISPGLVPPAVSSSDSFKSLVFLPRSVLNTYVEQKYSRSMTGVPANPYGQIGDNLTAVSLDGSQINMLNSYGTSYICPWRQYEQFGGLDAMLTRVAATYAQIDINNPIINQYMFAQSNTDFRLKIASNLLVSPIGVYNIEPFNFTYASTTLVFVASSGTLTVSRGDTGCYVYYIQGKVFTAANSNDILYKSLSAICFNPAVTTEVTDSMTLMAEAFGNDVPNSAATHVLLYSPHNAAETTFQLTNGNYSNLVACTADQLTAAANERSLVGYSIVENGFVSSNNTTPQISFVEFFYFVKVAVDTIATVACTISNILSYLLPASVINNRSIRSNNFVVVPIDSDEPIFYQVADSMDRSTSSVVNSRVRIGVVPP